MRLQDVLSTQLYFPILFPLMWTPANPTRWRVRAIVREKEQWMRHPLAEIERYQAVRIHDLLVHAARHCEFYRARFASVGLTDERDLTLASLERIPVLTKHDVQKQFDTLLAADADRSTWRANSSGGSTGHPVVLMQDARYREEGDATAFVSDRMQGWDFGNRVALLWGGPGDTQEWRKAKYRALLYLANQRLYDSFDMNATKMSLYHGDLERYQPDNIVSYAGSAYLFARFLLENKLTSNYPRVSIIASAETLTADMRAIIEECFQVPVYNRYGSREVGAIASECRHRWKLHMHLDKYIEVLDLYSGRPVFETPGRIVVTLLSNRAMPLIRYDLGDIGINSRHPCTCGINTPMLDRVLGRSSDFVLAPSGRLIHGEYFSHLFYGRRSIRQFQFVQESPTRYTVRIVLNDGDAAAQVEDIRTQIQAVLGSNADVQFEFPDSIPPLSSGKFRFVISNLKLPLVA